ncbi:MAG: shikimate kinase AroK [Gammaproteobacteria bacterium]|jgi:shikimate kinase|nr:shikimate kinase AroK [Gammaproteobacteria bacterium]MBP6052661.1 shikimate kinase AroK [Pseudomonadales bacterium]MBK6583284.1 shikimate kinase AroK [Gammaproteobacteria bacterium]MBK7519432.1 shikimate kinase AroK [Gammaproteobacteria bacterium]MBK7729819.1 shikimate kinase AroK [Gammaproteobacteria bacterium]
MLQARNVVLVGPMGAGKSTIGRTLAEQLGFVFRDTDTLIEERTGANIAWIFDVEGEEGFRERETAMIHELADENGMVLATGGGAILREENRRLLAGIGTVVYLETSVDQQLHRTRRDRKRPLLRTSDRERVLADLLAVRDPLYREIADLVLHTDARGARTVVNEVLAFLREGLV